MAVHAWISPGLAAALGPRTADPHTAVAGRAPLRPLARRRPPAPAGVQLPGADRAVRKRWTWPRASDRWKGALRITIAARSPARREADALRRLRALPSGPFAPEPLAVIESRTAGVLRSCTLLLVEIADAVDLAEWLVATPPGHARSDTLRDLAFRTREMHDAGLLDRDLHPRNVLVAAGRTWKIDCAHQLRARTSLGPERRALDLAALDVGFVRLATTRERVRFLRDYLGRDATRQRRRELCRLVDAARKRVDARESRRLPQQRQQ